MYMCLQVRLGLGWGGAGSVRLRRPAGGAGAAPAAGCLGRFIGRGSERGRADLLAGAVSFGRLRGGLSAGPFGRNCRRRLREAEVGLSLVGSGRLDVEPALVAWESRLGVEGRGTIPERPWRLG